MVTLSPKTFSYSSMMRWLKVLRKPQARLHRKQLVLKEAG
jgi:hypothetical protein